MDESQEAFQEGVNAFQAGNHDAALAAFAQVGKEHRKLQAQALTYIGRIQSSRGAYADAEASLRRSLSLQTRIDPQSLFHLGEVYFHARRWSEAEKYLQETIALEPKYTDAYIRLGMVFRETKRAEDARKAFELAIVNDSKAVVARYQLALICAEKEDYKRALSQLHFVKSLAETYAPAFVLQGDIYQRLGDHLQAIVEYVKVVEMGRADASLFWRLGRSFIAVKDRQQAVKAFEEAVRNDRQLWPAWFYAAQLREDLQDHARALAHYRNLLGVEEYKAVAREAIDRLSRLVPGGASALPPMEQDAPAVFEAPAETTRVSATHTLEAVQKQLTGSIGPRRTAPLKTTGNLAKERWVEEEPEDASNESVVSADAGSGAARETYGGPDIIDLVTAAVRSGSVDEVFSVLRHSSLDEITGTLRSRVDPVLKAVDPARLRQAFADQLAKRKGSGKKKKG
ncbi:MAG: tetratricopeptide repeat protein [Candidatus Sericytochromatia bacterium]|nr:tetratricopeptide repeat protein [Candidatus Sericytochromatia bacterium]